MKKQASAAAFTAFIIFLFFIPPTSLARNLQQQCSSSCGDSIDISYPFRLRGDPAGCGDAGFQLSCINKTTIMNYRGGTYYVRGISYVDRTIRLVDANLADGTCRLPNGSLSMDEATQDSRFPSLITYWQANFVNCSDTITGLADHRVPCLSRDAYQVYLNFSDRTLFSYDIPRTCKVISKVPTSSKNWVNYPYDETTLKLLASGFEMRWSVECRDCRLAGLGCVYKSNDDPRIFQCETIYEEDYVTELVAAIAYLVSNAVIYIELFIRFILLPLVVFVFLLHKCLTTRKTVADAGNVGPGRNIQMPTKPVSISPDGGGTTEIESEAPKQQLIPESMPRSA